MSAKIYKWNNNKNDILKKERGIWIDQKSEIEVSVDIVSSLGTFVEVEQTGESNRIFDSVVKKLERSSFAVRDTNHSGYLDLILNKNIKMIEE